MWPRRSQEPAKSTSAVPLPTQPRPPLRHGTTSASASGAARPHAPPVLPKADDDFGWLLRAAALKSTKPKKTSATAAALPNDSSSRLPTEKAKANKKRPLDPTASSSVTGASKSSRITKKPSASPKLPRGIGWSQQPPTKKSTASTTGVNSSGNSAHATAPPGESFEAVYAEVFGVTKRAKSSSASSAAAAAALLDDGMASLPLNAGTFLPDTSGLDHVSVAPTAKTTSGSARPATTRDNAAKVTKTKWDFSAPSAIALDAFATTSANKGSGDTSTATSAFAKHDENGSFSRWKDDSKSHSVSDNFVKLHMRKRVKGSTGKAKKRPAYLRTRNFGDDEEKAKKSQSKGDTPMGSGTSTGALLDDGVDFIEECLEMMNRLESNNSQQQQQPGTGTAATETAAVAEPPRCHHAMLSSRVLVKKKNKNHGRAFFSCPMGYDEGRCDFFLWEDNHTQFALDHLFQESTTTAAAEADGGSAAHVVQHFERFDLAKPLATQTTKMLTNLRLVFGHSQFRAGQQWAIQRVFAHKKRSLLVLPTGAGKSLCYQYPALFLPGVTLVISPLISLMNDQFHSLPEVLKQQATCVTASSASKTQYAEFVRDLLQGKLKLLFISPEKALTSGFQKLLTQMQKKISLVCVDEAHCISEWSHHFRPSYLRLQSIFKLADSVLAITATASRLVENDILTQLQTEEDKEDQEEQEEDKECVLRMPWQRDNLTLHVVRVASDDERLEKLCEVLTKSPVTGAVIMYVHQQWQAEAMANLLQERLVLDSDASAKNKWTKAKIGFYHAKMDPEVKEKVRLGFLNGRVKLVIATIAFGMGIDKQNVRLVVHYHVPSSIEHYLQQVGRAGRDGRPAAALLFLLDDDVRAFRSLLFSNALHESQVQRLVELLIFDGGRDQKSTQNLIRNQIDSVVPAQAAQEQEALLLRQNVVRLAVSSGDRSKLRLWLHVAWLEQYLDMKAATIETFLTLLSLHKSIKQEMKLTIHATAMSWCVVSLTESQLKAPTADPLLQKLVGTVMRSGSGDDSEPNQLGQVDVQVDGYHRHLTVHFHVAALAQQLLPLPVATQATAAADVDTRMVMVDVQARRLMQSVRSWQQKGQIRKFQMEKPAFDVSILWKKTGGQAGQEEQFVKQWTQLLYAKHGALEVMELKRLKYLFSALTSAATPSSTVLRKLAGSDSDQMESDSTQILEHKLSSYFEGPHLQSMEEEDEESKEERQDKDDSDACDYDGSSSENKKRHGRADDDDDGDAASWRALTAPLTANLIEAIERDMDVLISRPPNAATIEDEQNDDDDGGAAAASATSIATAGSMVMEWNGYNVARIFHGLASPCFPSKRWRDHVWWRKYSHVAFEQLVVIADKVVTMQAQVIDAVEQP